MAGRRYQVLVSAFLFFSLRGIRLALRHFAWRGLWRERYDDLTILQPTTVKAKRFGASLVNQNQKQIELYPRREMKESQAKTIETNPALRQHKTEGMGDITSLNYLTIRMEKDQVYL